MILIVVLAYLAAIFAPKLFRVQLQLKAENKSTWYIIKKLKSSYKKQYFYFVGVSLVQSSNLAIDYIFKDNLNQNTIRLVLKLSLTILKDLLDLYMFKFVWNVFNGVDAFLKLKGDESFPKRTKQCQITIFILMMQSFTVAKMIQNYYEFYFPDNLKDID